MVKVDAKKLAICHVLPSTTQRLMLRTVVYRDSVYRFSALYRFRALNAGDGAWSHHKCGISI